jgi:hypothetical protein
MFTQAEPAGRILSTEIVSQSDLIVSLIDGAPLFPVLYVAMTQAKYHRHLTDRMWTLAPACGDVGVRSEPRGGIWPAASAQAHT